MTPKVYLNSQLIDFDAAKIHVSSPALLHGVGLFETLRAYDGKPFKLQPHIDRLKASAEKLNMPIGDLIEQIPDAVTQVLQANELADARIRFTIAPPGPHNESAEPLLLIAAQATSGYPADFYQKGMTVYVCSDYRQSRQDPLAGHKTTSYFARLLVLRDAQERGCGEALWFTPENLLAEGCISNVLVVKAGRLATPPLDTPVLPGVTRAVILEIAQAKGLDVEEKPQTLKDLLDADEVFLTNAIMEVMPVTRVERRAIGDEKPGAITNQLRNAYHEEINRTLDKA